MTGTLLLLVKLIVFVLVIGLLVWLVNFLVDNLGVPEPFARVAKVLAVVVGIIVIVILLLDMVGLALL